MMEYTDAASTAEQTEVIIRAGLNPADWVVIREYTYRMIIRSRVTDEVKTIGK